MSWPLRALRQDGKISRTTNRVQIVPLLPTIPKSACSRTIFPCLFNGCLMWPTRRENVLCVRLRVDGWRTLRGRWDGYKQGLSLPQHRRSELGAGGLLSVPCLPHYDPFLWHLLHYNLSRKKFFFFLAVYSGLILEICFHLPTLTPGAACKLPGTKNQWWQQQSGRRVLINLELGAAPALSSPAGLTLGKNGQLGRLPLVALIFLFWALSAYSLLSPLPKLTPPPRPSSMGDGVGRRSLSAYPCARHLARQSTCMFPLRATNNSQMLVLPPFHRRGNWGTKRLRNKHS